MRYWLTPVHDERFEAKVADINGLYAEAAALAGRRERVLSTDEMTGVQALERLHPSLPMEPGRVERREFEYIRHGTLSFIVNRDVATGQVVAPTCGPTRTEADFVAHLRGVVATDPEAVRWHFVADNLDIHCSESLVRYVAELSGYRDGPGREGQVGRPEEHGDAGGVPERPEPPGGVPLHAEARLVAEPDRDLVQHPGAEGAEAGQLHLGGGPEGEGAGVHRVLQPDDGQAVPLELRQTPPDRALKLE